MREGKGVGIRQQPAAGVLDMVPADWGPKSGQGPAGIALTRTGAGRIDFRSPAHYFLVLLSPQPCREVRLASSRTETFRAPSGTVEIIPAGADFHARWTVPKESILIGLADGYLSELLEREFDTAAIDLHPLEHGLPDRTALRLATLIREEMDHVSTRSRLYLDSLMVALCIHVLRAHTPVCGRAALPACRGGLAAHVKREIRDFMHENLQEDISLEKLAGRAGLSYGHFLRAFRQTMGEPPHRYLLNLRVRRAEQLAAETDLPLKEIARKAGFSGQSHMTTAMRQILCVTPGEVRRLRNRSWPAESGGRSGKAMAAPQDG